MPKANLIGLGPPRTGTTTLHSLLSRSPDVSFACDKEMNHFGLPPRLTDGQYEAACSARRGSRYRGEITPVYLSRPESLFAIHEYNPDATVIVTLRDPVERIMSQYRHARAFALDDARQLEPTIAAEDLAGYLWGVLGAIANGGVGRDAWYSPGLSALHSRYELHLPACLQLFGDRLIVLLHDEIDQWPAKLTNTLGITFADQSVPKEYGTERISLSSDLNQLVDKVREAYRSTVHRASRLIDRDLAALWSYA